MSAQHESHTVEGKYEVTPLELFFDLVFVFAVSQLSHHLLEHLSWRGAAETVVLLVAVFTVWSYTSWAATMIPLPNAGTRGMLLAVMLLGLLMNAAIPRAFAESAWPFLVPLLAIQTGRTLWTIRSAPNAVYRDHYIRVAIWFLALAPLWIVGAAAGAEHRLLWWTPAAALELCGTWLAHPVPGRRLQSANVPFNADHMLERCRLFLLIALGETVLTTGTAIAEAPITAITLLTGLAAFAGTVALWSLTFGRSFEIVLEHLERTSDPVRVSRYAINALTGMVAGLIVVAVANEKVIGHPHEQGGAAIGLLLGVGPMLFMLAQGWYLWRVPNTVSRLHWVGGVALGAVGFGSTLLPNYAALGVVAAALVILAITDRRISSHHRRP